MDQLPAKATVVEPNPTCSGVMRLIISEAILIISAFIIPPGASSAASRQGLCSPGRLRGRAGGSGGGWAHNAPDARAADCCAVQSCPKAGHSAVTCPERGAEAWLLAGLSVGVQRSLGCCDRGWMRLGPREQTSTRLTGHRPELQNVMSASKSHRAPIPTRIYSSSSTVWLVCKRMSTGAC